VTAPATTAASTAEQTAFTVEVKSANGATGRTVELPADVFGVQVNIPLIHQVVVAQLAAARQGTHSTKTRGEVRGGGRKPYRQKGTGRARQGSTRAPQFVGGGVVHGPKPRDYAQRTPKKMKALALRGALSDRFSHERIHVVDSLVGGDLPSTKNATAMLAAISERKHVLVVAERTDAATWKSLRNHKAVHLLSPGQLNTYDVLISDEIIFTKDALDTFLAGPVKGKSAKATAGSAELDEPIVAEVEAAPTTLTKKPAKADDAVTAQDAVDYGADSHLPLDDDSEPEGFPIKGNASSKLYHVPGSAFYKRTVAEVWFRTPEAAEAAGFELPPSQRGKEEDS